MRNRERAPRPRHRPLAQTETTSGRYTRMTAARDAIVIGSGHNGLVAAAYLARAGLSVEVLERNAVAGGAVASEELTEPGFLHDTFSAWHPLFKLSAAYGELGPELADRGLRRNDRHGRADLRHRALLARRREACLAARPRAWAPATARVHRRRAVVGAGLVRDPLQGPGGGRA